MFGDYHNPNDFWQQGMPDPYGDMDEDERVKVGCLHGLAYILTLLIGLCILLAMSSCTTTQYIPVPEYHTDTLIQTKVVHDSIYINDSTVITEKGDTVTIEKWHTKYVEKQIHDTTYVSKTDTVAKPYPVVKEVEKDLHWWQKMLMICGTVFFLSLLYILYLKLRKP